jgi:hypothetical protein
MPGEGSQVQAWSLMLAGSRIRGLPMRGLFEQGSRTLGAAMLSDAGTQFPPGPQ